MMHSPLVLATLSTAPLWLLVVHLALKGRRARRGTYGRLR
jgi:hypothetical protein